MSIKLKALGLALMAALAISAVAVVGASAEEEAGGHLTSELANTRITGEDEPGEGVQTELHSFGQSVFCTTLPVYHATAAAATVTELTVTPTYENCRTRGTNFVVDIDMKGCDYLFTVRKNAAKHSTVHLKCPKDEGPRLTVTGTFGNCVIEITPTQTPTKGVIYDNKGSGKTADVTVTVTAEAVHAVILSGGFFQCGTSETTEANGRLTGNATVKGFNPVGGAQVGIAATGG